MTRCCRSRHLRKSNPDTPLDFSYFRTTEPKLTPALRKIPLTSLRHTIWTGDACPQQTIIWRINCLTHTKSGCNNNPLLQPLILFYSADTTIFLKDLLPKAPYSSAANVSSYFSKISFWIRSLVPELIGCAISRYSPSAAFRLGIAQKDLFPLQ